MELISIFPIGDIRESIGLEAKDADVCIIEEPEHINVTMPTSHAPWTDTFKHVVGIIHTNYLMYTGPVLAPIVIHFARSVGRLHCDKVIKLSDTLQTFAAEKECTSNVHGIRSDFLEEGKRRALMNTQESPNKIYFIGKLLWAKGLDRLLTLENSYKKKTGHYFDIDIIGSGAEAEEIQRAFHGRGGKRPFSSHGSLSDLVHEIPKSRHEFRKDPIPASFLGRMDHALLTDEYKIFVNPSITEVLCTTTAEVSCFSFYSYLFRFDQQELNLVLSLSGHCHGKICNHSLPSIKCLFRAISQLPFLQTKRRVYLKITVCTIK